MAETRYKTRFSLTSPSSVLAAVTAFQAGLKEWSTWLITQIMLVAMYVLGIGVSALGKRVAKLFVSMPVWSQGWQTYTDSQKLEKMY